MRSFILYFLPLFAFFCVFLRMFMAEVAFEEGQKHLAATLLNSFYI